MAMFVYAFIGLIVGALAFVAMPSETKVRLFSSGLLGLLGGVVGGLFGSSISPPSVSTLSPLGVVLAVVGSLAVSVAMHLAARRRYAA
ncbi:hypothetical protein [Melittangium boletus]|uniref:hypothetical protein n=1 Tax=Melittangium boletus TaxID=83453 RepID=UPI003DA45A14